MDDYFVTNSGIKLEGHSVERMYLRQRCFDCSLPQWIKPW